MRRASIGILVAGMLCAAVAMAFNGPGGDIASSSNRGDANGGSQIEAEAAEKNPWTHLKPNNKPRNFQFAILTDRTGGRRPGVFTRAIEKVNLLQPEFVLTVGDLIEGYTEDPGMWALEWSELESKVEQLQMPFFFCAGNHDISNLPMSDEWHRKFGRSYYHFKYHGVLFLVLNTEEKTSPVKKPPYYISPKQRKWVKKTLDANRDLRWTFVILHKPAWYYTWADHGLFGWKAVEESLKGRNYTVFAGHNHRYGRYVRNGMEHYILATSGGASRQDRGLKAGYFDHFTWVTMRNNRPVIANLALSGVFDKNVRNPPLPNLKTRREPGDVDPRRRTRKKK